MDTLSRRSLRRTPEPPEFIAPQLCSASSQPPNGAGWLHEVKLDGYRAQLRVARGRVSIRTRQGLDWTDRFSGITRAAAALPDVLLDGEIVALSNGLPDFAALQRAGKGGRDLRFYGFDLLYAGGKLLIDVPLVTRKERLKNILANTADPALRYVPHFAVPGHSLLAAARRLALEGLVSKRLDAPYRSGRHRTWLKIKCRLGQEFVLGGFTHRGGVPQALLLGLYCKGSLHYVGRVGSGLGAQALKVLAPHLARHASPHSPFVGGLHTARSARVQWLEPKLVVEIAFAGWSTVGKLRQPSYKGLRFDKDPKAVMREEAL